MEQSCQWKDAGNKAHATILKMGGHIREAARFTITLGANKISNFKGKWLGNDETIYYFEW